MSKSSKDAMALVGPRRTTEDRAHRIPAGCAPSMEMADTQRLARADADEAHIAMLDMSERHRATEALRDSERRYRTLFDAVPMALVVARLDGMVLAANHAALETTGYSPRELGALNISSLYVEHDDWDALFSHLNEHGRVRNRETALRRKDGKEAWISINAERILYEGLQAVLIALRDITVMREATDAVTASEARYRSVADNLGIGISLIGPAMDVLALNRQMRTWFPGIRTTQHPACYRVFNDPPREQLCPHCPSILSFLDGERHEALTERPGPDGIAHYRVVASPVKDDAATVTAVVEMVEDITRQKRVEEDLLQHHGHLEELVRERTEELRAEKERAETTDRLKSVFLATMSHELRTPLNSIMGFTSILFQELSGPLNAEQKRHLNIVHTSSRHLLNLINDVLDLSKIETGHVRVAHEPFDLAASIEKVLHASRPLAERKGLTFTADIAPGVNRIVGDQRCVEQILLNLTGNALKFTAKGGIRVVCTRRESDVVISVIDTGIGIGKDDMKKLFKPFQRISTGDGREYEGTGLGLSICKRLAELLKGSIWAESEPGTGSSFTFSLPATAGAP